MIDKKLESLAYRLKDLSSLRSLFSELNFDYEDKPVNKDSWTNEQKDMVKESKIVAKKNDYRIYYIQTNTDSLREWKGISSKIIKENHGFCMVCSHNPNGFKWVFSSLSKEFSKSFSETRHVPINIKPDAGVPKTFVDFLEKIKINDDSSASSIVSKISNAFDSFAIQIHDELTVNVFEALKKLSEGIILDKSNNLELDEQTLEEIRESTFILLYRIMFVLYAEDRQIFPNESFYDKNFSLRWIKTNLILKSDHNIAEYSVNKRLRELFRLIEMGSEDLNYDRKEFFMRSYYGRLFDRKIHSNLEKWNIPNKNLLDAIGFLTRTRDKNGNYFFLDYAALETRHLGAIYEHLLEYHLTVKNGKVADLPNPEERKTTGSYYTPKYIVDYIVENSIGPLIDNIVKETDDPSKQIDEILALNILDPAMGSGHFLVGATNYIAKRICKIEYKGDVTEQAFIERKRDVARRCIYGVDLNPLAVDLASVSLWLETLSSEKPLSFLSAHLKSGNSLIGSSIEDVLDTQTTLMETTKGRTSFKKTVRDFIMLEMLEDDTPEAVKTKTVKYNKIQSEGQIYYNLKFMINAKLAQSFDVDVPPIGDYVIKIGENSLDFYTDERWQQVKEIAEEYSFFHWDLEFPDIFYDGDGKRKKNPGFDGVVGNPPYVRADHDNDDYQKMRKGIIENNEFSTLYKKWDLYIPFIERGMQIVKKGGITSMIISNSYNTASYAEKSRKMIHEKYDLIQVNLFKNIEIFEGTGVENTILFVKNQKPENKTTKVTHIDKFENTSKSIQKSNDQIFRILESISINVKTNPLGDICFISKGMVINANEKTAKGEFTREDVISDDKTTRTPKKYIEAKDVTAYHIKRVRYLEWDTDRVPKKISRPTFPELYKHPKIMRGSTTGAICDTKGILTNHSMMIMVPHHSLSKVNNKSIQGSIKKSTKKDRIELGMISKKYDLWYLLAVINSNFAYEYLNSIRQHKLKNFFYPDELKSFPIPDIDLDEQDVLVNKAKKLTELYKRSHDERGLQHDIDKINEDLNDLVNNLYRIEDESKKESK